ncbi:MAG: hypothetical protein R3C68_08215 [Myxococcota bacterium]
MGWLAFAMYLIAGGTDLSTVAVVALPMESVSEQPHQAMVIRDAPVKPVAPEKTADSTLWTTYNEQMAAYTLAQEQFLQDEATRRRLEQQAQQERELRHAVDRRIGGQAQRLDSYLRRFRFLQLRSSREVRASLQKNQHMACEEPECLLALHHELGATYVVSIAGDIDKKNIHVRVWRIGENVLENLSNVDMEEGSSQRRCGRGDDVGSND